tara:strand:+ start:416 stop:655 length:240 start_codon:yes stop_codon:yes gene_type:complete
LLGYRFLGLIMAVQKSKVTRSRRGQRRSHDSLKSKMLSTDPVSGEKHVRHQMTKDGFYKGRLVKDLRKPIKEEAEEVTS